MEFVGSLNPDLMSDETFDLQCTMCKRKGRNREAEKYCVECNDYYCLLCVKVHEDVPSLTGHKILDHVQFPSRSSRRKHMLEKGSSQSQPAAPTEKCDRHSHYYIDMYCQNHDDVGCATCMAVDHRLCQDIFYIPEFLQGNPSASTTEQVQEKLDIATRHLSNHHDDLQHTKLKLVKGKKEALENIGNFRQEINDRLDELERKSVDKIENIYKGLIDRIDNAMNAVQKNTRKLTSARDKVMSPDSNFSQAFVDAKKGEQIANDATVCVEDSKDNLQTADVDFTRDHRLTSLLEELAGLGNISQTVFNVAGHTASDSADQRSAPQYSPRTKGQHGSGNAQNTSALYLIRERNTYQVSAKSDKYACDIVSACVVDLLNIVLSDNANKRLKRLNSSTFTVTDYCDLPGYPWQVCLVRNQEVAVSLTSQRMVQFITTGIRMEKSKRVKTDFDCYGLAFAKDELYISDARFSVYIYSESGHKLKQLGRDDSGQELFSDIFSLTVSKNGSKIYISEKDEGLTVIDRAGKVLGKCTEPDLKGTYSCDVTDGKNLLVCGSRSILQFGPDGNLLGKIVKSDQNVYYQTICCNMSQGQFEMIVCPSLCNNIEVYDLV